MATFTATPTTIDEAARRQFEDAWKQGQPRPIEEFLASPESPNYLGTLEELIAIDLEMAWKRIKEKGPNPPSFAGAPRLEGYLVRFPRLKAHPPLLVRLIRQEYRVRHRFGDGPNASDYLERFPELDSQRTEILGGLGEVTIGPIAPTPAPAPGDSLGRYRLCAEHGKGGFGLVWRALDEALGREVAVKQLGQGLVRDAVLRARFLAEARIAARLQHPGVVPVYDVGAADLSHPYYTMKLVAGQTYAEAIRRFYTEKVPEGERAVEYLRLLNAFLSVARTMAFAHARQVIHRDLKPQNIILGEYGETVILDWGLAKVLGEGGDDSSPSHDNLAGPSPDLTRPGTIMGTPAYMAPEQASGRVRDVDQRSDVFALGTILYHLLTGRKPFEGESSQKVLEAVVDCEPARPRAVKKGLHRALEAICLKAMAKDRDKRYADAAGLTRDLELYLADEPVGAYPEPWTTRLGRWARRRRRLLTGIFTLIVLASVVLVAWLEVGKAQRQRDQETITRREEARRAAEEAGKVAGQRIKDNGFDDAARILGQAVTNLAAWTEHADLRQDLERKQDKAKRLAEFYRLHRLAWRHNYHEKDEEALAAMKGALDQFGALDKEDWDQQLPKEELTPEQLVQLKEDIHGLLLLYALTLIKPTIPEFGDPKTGPKIYKNAHAICLRAQKHRPTQAGALLDLYCRYGAKELNVFQGLLALGAIDPNKPQTPTDFHCLGIGHMLLAEGGYPIFKKILSPWGLKIGGVDFVDPQTLAHAHLLRVTRLEPKRYWAYIWLGRYLSNQKDLVGAELACHTCITLHPGDPDGYLHRGQILFFQGKDVKEQLEQALREKKPPPAGISKEVYEERWMRAWEDLDMSVRLDPRNPENRFIRFLCLTYVPDPNKLMDEAMAWMDLERPGDWLKTYANGQYFLNQWQDLKLLAGSWSGPPASPKRARIVLARAHLSLDERDEALKHAQAVPLDDRDYAYARAVMGAVFMKNALKGPKADEALLLKARTELEAARTRLPTDFQTISLLVQLAAREGKNEDALQYWKSFLEHWKRIAPWQEVEACLACARLQARLGRKEEARPYLEQARPHNLLAVERVEEELGLR